MMMAQVVPLNITVLDLVYEFKVDKYFQLFLNFCHLKLKFSTE